MKTIFAAQLILVLLLCIGVQHMTSSQPSASSLGTPSSLVVAAQDDVEELPAGVKQPHADSSISPEQEAKNKAEAAESKKKEQEEHAQKNKEIDRLIKAAKAKIPKKFVWEGGKKPKGYKQREAFKAAKKDFYAEKRLACKNFKAVKKKGDNDRPIDFKGGDENGNVDPREMKEILKTLRGKATTDTGMADMLKKAKVEKDPEPVPAKRYAKEDVGDLDEDDCYDDDEDEDDEL